VGCPSHPIRADRVVVVGEERAVGGIEPELGINDPVAPTDRVGITEDGLRLEHARLGDLHDEVGRGGDVVPLTGEGGRHEGRKDQDRKENRGASHRLRPEECDECPQQSRPKESPDGNHPALDLVHVGANLVQLLGVAI
jgi:hypothetical protein